VNIFPGLTNIHKQSAKFYCIKFERKVYEICFFPSPLKIKHQNLKSPVKNLSRLHCAEGVNSGVKGLNMPALENNSFKGCFTNLHIVGVKYFKK
jgi:hypothetical protein